MKKPSVLKAPVRTVALLFALFVWVPVPLWSQTEQHKFDIVIKDGIVYDGTGNSPLKADVGIRGDRIIAIGKLDQKTSKTVIDASGLAVARCPGPEGRRAYRSKTGPGIVGAGKVKVGMN